jgi:phosphoglycerate dehydrogenase-like enzyme
VARPVVFCSRAAIDRYAIRDHDVELIEFEPGEHVADDAVGRIEVAFFSNDLYPAAAPSFLRVCLDAPSLKWLHVFNAGVDHPVFGMFLDRGVRLTTSSGASGVAIAHHVVLSLLALVRDLPGFLRDQAAHRWAQRRVGDVEGRVVAVLGMGPIGSEAARLAGELGMRPIGVRRSVTGEEPCETWTFDRLDELLDIADDLVLALPLTEETRGVIGAAEIARLRPGSHIVNVGRGELIDEPALIDALRDGRIAGAALDVFATEPLPVDSPLWDMPNVIVTPHSSGATESTERKSGEAFVSNLGAYLRGEALRNEVTR